MISNISMAYRMGFSSGFGKYASAHEAVRHFTFLNGELKNDDRKCRWMRKAFKRGFDECKQIKRELTWIKE
jgi:hypothetical protein